MTRTDYTELEANVSPSALLGYLNLSEGRPDPRWQQQLDRAYAFFVEREEPEPWSALADWLTDALQRLRSEGETAFQNDEQARAVLQTAREVLPAYREFHRDLLAHLSDADLFQPFFLVRVCEGVLTDRSEHGQSEPSEAIPRIVGRLNDFVGHRPVPQLETRPQGEAYPHEKHRPVPIWLTGVGAASGRWQFVVDEAMRILEQTDPDLLAEAQFDPEALEEIALDVRAYDHLNPVNRRPNYVFGEWDPSHLDRKGCHSRYIVRKITLDALMDRVEHPGDVPAEQALWEGAAVLAGTILMATGVGGMSPTSHDSSTSLAVLLPRIARYRDAFYEHLLTRMQGDHARRLRAEIEVTHQPFGSARQSLNAYLARNRAAQLEYAFLSRLFAEMGYPDASGQMVQRIPAVSGRMMSTILSLLTSANIEIEQGRLKEAASRLPEVEAHIHRGVSCGALADPWNILGYQGLYPLSSAREDSIRDTRQDDLVQTVERTFHTYTKLILAAVSSSEDTLVPTLMEGLERLATWWDQFATTEVSDIRSVLGGEAVESTRLIADVMKTWREQGQAAADLSFWREHLDSFRSPKSFAFVVDALLRRRDFAAAMGLLISWLGQAENLLLEDGVYSFHALALRWALALTQPEHDPSPIKSEPLPDLEWEERCQLVERFLAYLEANAEEYWEVPSLALDDVEEEEDDESSEENIFDAAYEGVTYQDTTDDSEGELDEGYAGIGGDFPLEEESERLEKRLRFLSTVARLWIVAARFLANGVKEQRPQRDKVLSTPADWLAEAQKKKQELLVLLSAVHRQPLPTATSDPESLAEYDRRRVVKEHLLFTIIGTSLDMSLAIRWVTGLHPDVEGGSLPASSAMTQASNQLATELERALLSGERDRIRALLPPFLDVFRGEPLLYVSLKDGGQPSHILRVRLAQTILRVLLVNLPRLGLVRETFEVLQAAREMEQNQPRTARGITEFNHFFQSALQSVVESILAAADDWTPEHASDETLTSLLEELTAPFLGLWIQHSRTLQLSSLEAVEDEEDWDNLRTFIERYGNDLFHARFMSMGNLRGILHQGAGEFFEYLEEHPDPLQTIRLIDDLDNRISREEAVEKLELVLQAVVENYEEYKDYNATTTQSDYGSNLYMLLEFLRLKMVYERQAWQLRPLVLVHEILAKHANPETAVRWQESLARVSRDNAETNLRDLAELEARYSIRLQTIRDKINEQFLKPLALDRIVATIESAIQSAKQGEPSKGPFDHLFAEIEAYSGTPSGVGLDVPQWLRRLEAEVQRVQTMNTSLAVLAESFFHVDRQAIAYEDLRHQLDEWRKPWLEAEEE